VSESSVVIPAYGHCPHLPALLRALLNGVERPSEIIVSHSGSHDPTGAIAEISGAVTVLHHPGRLLGGAARNRGAAIARSEWLAFVDADVRPQPAWLQRNLAAARGAPGRFVVGSVGCAVSGGYWGMCNWLSEFSEQAPWHRARAQAGGASCNMIVRRADFHAAGGFAEDYQPGEDTMLFFRLRAMGRQQWFEPAARVDHFNIAGLSNFVRHQYRLGFHSALVRQRVALRGSLATRIWPLALALWIPRLALMGGRLGRGGPGWWVRGLLFAPGLVLGSWAWVGGFVRQVGRNPQKCP
jgi:glycosyltransferase involved in cell wall biosynthesis